MSKHVYEKLLKVRKAVPYIQKVNRGHQYTYVGSSDVLGALREKLDEVGLLLFPKVKESKVTVSSVENLDKYGNKKITNTYFTELKMEFVWVCAESGEEVIVPFYAQGVDTAGEKGVGKALTYAEKYFLLKQFNIATDGDDPDSFQQRLDNSTPNFIKEEQVKELSGMLNEISLLMKVPASNYMNALKINNLERITVEQFADIRSRIKYWLDQAKQKTNANPSNQNNNQPAQQQGNVEQQQPQQQLQQHNQQQETTFVMGKKEHIKSPNGVPVIKFVVQGRENETIFARSEEMIQKVSEINEGETFSGELVEEGGFTFIVSTRGQNQSA